MTRYQLRFAGLFPDEILDEILKQAEASDVAFRLQSIAFLVPKNDGDLNTERLIIETRTGVSREELPRITRALRQLPALHRRNVAVDVYEVAGKRSVLTTHRMNRGR